MSAHLHAASWLHQHSVRIAASGLCAVAVLIVAWSRKRSRSRLFARRFAGPQPGAQSAARTFAQLLESYGFDRGIALATFCYLDESRGGALAIQPETTLEGDLDLTPEQVEHTMLALMALLGRKPELHWHRQPIETVEDLIGVLQAAPKTESGSARVAA